MSTIRIYFDLDTMEQVAGVLAFADTMGLPVRMAPMGRKRGPYMKHAGGPGSKTDHPINKFDRYQLGDPEHLPAESESREQWPRVERIFGDGPVEYRLAVAQLAKNARMDRRRAGFTVAFMIRSGALVRVDDQE